MSEVERKNFDLDKFLIFFKNFFRKQSVYSFSIFVIFKLLYNGKVAISIYSLIEKTKKKLIIFDGKKFKSIN